MAQLTALIMRLAATDSDHLLDNDGFGSELKGAIAARSRRARSYTSAPLKLTQPREVSQGLQAAKRQSEKTRWLRRGAPVESLTANTLDGVRSELRSGRSFRPVNQPSRKEEQLVKRCGFTGPSHLQTLFCSVL